MLFPEVKRVIYKRNPLERVICQLRFPPILKIETEIPAAFQERVGDTFPMYSEASEMSIEIPQEDLMKDSVDAFAHILQAPKTKNHRFSSLDSHWDINLTRSFIALTSKRYERWEDFRHKLEIVISALREIYSPSHFLRIGLRYIDVIKRSDIGLIDVPWRELLQKDLLGLIGVEPLSSNVRSANCFYEVNLPDQDGVVRIAVSLTNDSKANEEIFVIDMDLFTPPLLVTTESDVLTKLNAYNREASRMIRWCFSDRLHQALEPEQI